MGLPSAVPVNLAIHWPFCSPTTVQMSWPLVLYLRLFHVPDQTLSGSAAAAAESVRRTTASAAKVRFMIVS